MGACRGPRRPRQRRLPGGALLFHHCREPQAVLRSGRHSRPTGKLTRLVLQGSETRLLRGWEKLLCACLTLLPGCDWVLLSYVLQAYFRILYVDPVL